ncbi:elongation factor Ts, mitochondrial isoform X2 [Eurytemora carolleeae]|uniref:elongation factor Ts, mitochondrial isoform X2 n=1 Tax=Eurytemora carolleeae TaxID=1294199 RepID=UPI000C79543A|nr:elongation factor Ts, mitochondrial isoform X2 [Eurytemora carolleeae]|eukprot:XP_023335526.1 elongation factor Ts, mitochondrial-like isoform X2 [Eurytemora affinis]
MKNCMIREAASPSSHKIESENDLQRAEGWLKEQAQAQGWAKAQKLQGRNTTQGLLGVLVQENSAAMVELNCETDFVARNKKFISILETLANTCASLPVLDTSESLSRSTLSSTEVGLLKTEDDQTIADLVALNIGQIGENMAFGDADVFHSKSGSGIKLVGLAHPQVAGSKEKIKFGRYTAVMAYTSTGEGTLPDGLTEEHLTLQLCQHIIGMAPTCIKDEEDKENSLYHQVFLMDEDLKVGDLTAAAGINIISFLRREVGRRG